MAPFGPAPSLSIHLRCSCDTLNHANKFNAGGVLDGDGCSVYEWSCIRPCNKISYIDLVAQTLSVRLFRRLLLSFFSWDNFISSGKDL